MTFDDFKLKLEHSECLFREIISITDLDSLQIEVSALSNQASTPEFWASPEKAMTVGRRLAFLRSQLERIEKIRRQLRDSFLLIEGEELDGDSDLLKEASDDLQLIQTDLNELLAQISMYGEYDPSPALVAIRAGAGGDDATDFAEMLMRMYLRYAARTTMNVEVLETSYAEGAGIRSTLIKFETPFAFGKLSAESGTHRLVRISPFNAAGKRQTSFAAVEVVPLIESDDSIVIPDNEIRVDVFRSSGPGGQSVNTTDSAVRITHLPTGIVVSCQNEKSQLQNKIEAMRVLQSRLLDNRRKEEDAQKKQLAGDVKASWGEQMRSYVLAPYRMVKDLRTNHEENNPDDVFSGKLDGFISAGIKWRAQQNR